MRGTDDLTTIPDGWRPRAWAQRLEYMAAGCAGHCPERATELRAAAAAIHRQLGPPRICDECRIELERPDPGAFPDGALICTPCEFRDRERRQRARGAA